MEDQGRGYASRKDARGRVAWTPVRLIKPASCLIAAANSTREMRVLQTEMRVPINYVANWSSRESPATEECFGKFRRAVRAFPFLLLIFSLRTFARVICKVFFPDVSNLRQQQSRVLTSVAGGFGPWGDGLFHFRVNKERPETFGRKNEHTVLYRPWKRKHGKETRSPCPYADCQFPLRPSSPSFLSVTLR